MAARLGAVCPEGLAILGAELVPPGAPGLGKLVTGYDLLVQPPPDGMRLDAARLGRIAATFLARSEATVARDEKLVDVRALVEAIDVLDGPAAAALAAGLGWDEEALFRVRVRVSPLGSARPTEVARALGVWGPEDVRARHARVARLGLVGVAEAPSTTAQVAPVPAAPEPAPQVELV